MTGQSLQQAGPTWTWADQISSYRYWGLLAFYALSIAGSSSIFLTFPITTAQHDLSVFQIALLMASIQIGGSFGFYLAWTATRRNPVRSLFFFGVLQLLGAGLMATQLLVAMFLGGAIFGAGAAAVVISVPAILAGGRGGLEAFMVAFAAVSIFAGFVKGVVSPLAGASLAYIPSPMMPLIFIGIPVCVGLLFLARVNRCLFSEPPELRETALQPREKDPTNVFLLSVIPLLGLIYALRWLSRAYGEVMAIAPSAKLLSPKSAVVAAVLIPVLVPVMTATLADSLNEQAEQRGMAPLRNPMAIFIWTILFYPVALSLIQGAINRSIEPPGRQITHPQ